MQYSYKDTKHFVEKPQLIKIEQINNTLLWTGEFVFKSVLKTTQVVLLRLP